MDQTTLSNTAVTALSPLGDAAEHDVLAVQPRGFDGRQEELQTMQ